jgi:hypothetical protein
MEVSSKYKERHYDKIISLSEKSAIEEIFILLNFITFQKVIIYKVIII